MTVVDPRWVQRVARAAPTVGAVRLVCVDGPAGAGKTTLAAALASALASALEAGSGTVPVVHGDEVYEGWDVVAASPDRLAAFAALATRLDGWLLDPWRHGRPGRHPVWDWYADGWGETVEVRPAPVVVLEGVGLASRPLRAQSVLSLWVDADEDVRLPRVLARDGEALREQMLAWQRDEHAWHTADRTAQECDVVVTT